MDVELTWEQALEIVVARTGHEAYRRHCADDHPEHAIWRKRMVEKATGQAPVSLPPITRQAANLGRALFDWAVSGFSMASEEQQAWRLAICSLCPQWSDGRCLICGCHLSAKIALRTEHCPINKW